jgi:hypothetical protein
MSDKPKLSATRHWGQRPPTPLGIVRRRPPTPTGVYETLWRFACERQQVFNRRLAKQPSPWTPDLILQRYRFTNAYRASDRVSQYLIRHVIYRPDLPASPRETLFRILLFKLFNRIETWQILEREFSPITLESFQFDRFAERLTWAKRQGLRLYSAAYIMPSTGALGEQVKHRGHLRLVDRIIQDGLAEKVSEAPSLEATFKLLLSYPTLGRFLAFQFAIDINYSGITDFSEMDFVVAGPGALDGLRKCFADPGDYSETDIIRWACDRQETDPERWGIKFPTLYGRSLQLIDMQNLFCEVGKYARVAHPLVRGTSDRARIKQVYRPGLPAPRLFYPPKWKVNQLIPECNQASEQSLVT